MLEKINELREVLNDMMDKQDISPNKILKTSQELDILIVEYYRNQTMAKGSVT